MKTTFLVEALDLTEAKIDSENRTIKDVVLIKEGMSQNRKFYTANALQNSVSVFENANAYADHMTPEQRKSGAARGILSTTGWYSNVRYVEGKLLADRHFSRNSAGEDVWRIAEDIVMGKAPATLAGLSINAIGQGVMKKFPDGEALEVATITKGHSVDDITTPAAGGGYTLTAGASGSLEEDYLKEITFEEWFEARPEFVKRVQGEMKTVRQDEAIKAAKAEADTLKVQLEDMQESLKAVQVERDAALVETQSTVRKLAIVELLAKVTLPRSFKDDLQKRLLALEENEWGAVIEMEIQKAKAANVLPRVTTTGADPTVHTRMVESVPSKPIVNWAEVDTPEKQKALLERKQ